MISPGGGVIPLGTHKQRTLLAALALDAGRPVTADVLIDRVWDTDPPAQARNALHAYLARLRKALAVTESHQGGSVRIERDAAGYLLRVEPARVDLLRFRALHRQSLSEGADPGRQAETLNRALSLWSGPALAGAIGGWAERARAGLDAEHAESAVLWGRAALRVGQHDAVILRLRELAGQHPLIEPLTEVLMLALRQAGRPAEAMDCYSAARRYLVAELGSEPGPALRELHGELLRGDGENPDVAAVQLLRPSRVSPAELPPRSGRFTGRTRETANLNEVVSNSWRAGTLPLIAVVGAAGVGKTSFVVHWAHRVAAEFPDGQIFIDLRGFSAQTPVRPAQALRRLLRSLGVESERVPDSLSEATALYRSLLAGKRTLVVLDNAISAEQVEALLPGGSANAVLVTSRNRLAGLAVRHGGSQFVLDALPADQAHTLINLIIGGRRSALEPKAVQELAVRCGHLPLALCIAAANLADDPTQSIATYLAKHHAGRWLTDLAVPGGSDHSVQAAFDLSLRTLNQRQQHLLVLLGLVPGPDFTAEAAAALTAEDRATSEEDLARLVNAHLLQRTSSGRFAFHDLIQEYARNRADTIQPAERTAATGRLYAYYWAVSDVADRALQPGALRLPAVDRPTRSDAVPTRLSPLPSLSEQEAREWFGAELVNLVAACRHAAQHGPRPDATRLADALGGYLWTQRDLLTWSTVAQAAALAARATGDRHAMAAAEIALARIADCRGDYQPALAHLRIAVDLARQADWPAAQAAALSSTAALLTELGDHRAADQHHRDALSISRSSGARLQEGRTLVHLGIRHFEQGQLTTAYDVFVAALTLIDAEGSRIGRTIILNNLAQICVLRRNFDEAFARAHDTLRICAEVGYVPSNVVARAMLSASKIETGDVAGAFAEAHQALAVAAELDDPYYLGVAHHWVATTYDAAGNRRRAIESHRAAYRFTTLIQSRYLQVEHSIALALAQHRLSRAENLRLVHGSGVPELERSLQISRDNAYRGLEGAALGAQAEIARDAGQLQRARQLARHALSLQSQAGWRTAGDLLSALLAVPAAGPAVVPS